MFIDFIDVIGVWRVWILEIEDLILSFKFVIY